MQISRVAIAVNADVGCTITEGNERCWKLGVGQCVDEISDRWLQLTYAVDLRDQPRRRIR